MNPREKHFLLFMVERENIRLRREAGQPWPWTEDAILRDFKFTNVKRRHDRVSRIYEGWYKQHERGASGTEIVYNAAFARYFGRPEFVLFAGWQKIHRPWEIVKKAAEWEARGEKTFTGAYMITNLGREGPKVNFVAEDVLGSVWERAAEIANTIRMTHSWRAAHELLSCCLGFGGTGFMGKEVLLDTMYTSLWRKPAVDWQTWCPVGPGALRGLNRVAERPAKKALTQARALDELLSVYKNVQYHWPWPDDALDLHDIQFQLCEFDKYERARLGEGRPRARYTPKKENA